MKKPLHRISFYEKLFKFCFFVIDGACVLWLISAIFNWFGIGDIIAIFIAACCSIIATYSIFYL